MRVNGEELLRRLRAATRLVDEDYVVRWAVKKGLPSFLALVSVILSQNTSDKNALRSLRLLIDRGLDTPQSILGSPEDRVLEALRPSGMYRQRLVTLKRLSKAIVDGGLDLDGLCRKPTPEALEELTQVKGIGVKTAEVFLSAYCSHPTFPIDRHIMRITRRVTGRDRMSYREASDFWKKIFPPQHYREAHLRLIDVGRQYCRPRNPRCGECPLNTMCTHASKNKEGAQ